MQKQTTPSKTIKRKLTVEDIQEIITERIPEGLITTEHTDTEHWYRYRPLNILYPSVTALIGTLEVPHLKKWAARLAVDHMLEYLVPGKIVPIDIREVADAAIMVHQDQFEDAGDIGREGHKVIDLYLKEWIMKGMRPPNITSFIKGTDARLWAITRSAELFCNDFEVIPIASELNVAFPRFKYAGQLDSLMMVGVPENKGDPACEHSYNQYQLKYDFGRRCTKCKRHIRWYFSLVDWKTSNTIEKPEYALQVSAYCRALIHLTGLRPQKTFIVKLDKGRAKYEIMEVLDYIKTFRIFTHISYVHRWINNGTAKLLPLKGKERIDLTTL